MKKSLKQLRGLEAELKAEGRQLLDAAEAAGGMLNAAQETRFAALEAEIEALKPQIATAERDADRRRAMEGTALEPAGRTSVGQERSALDPRAGFHSIAEFARAVHRAHPNTAGGVVDPRLVSMYQAAPTGYMRETSSNDGFMVPPEFRDRIWQLVFDADNLMSEIDAEPTTSNQVNDLSDETTPWGSAGVQAKWRVEASQMSPTRPTVKPRSCILHELYAFVTATDELLEDAPRLNNRLETKAAEAINWKIDDSIVYGNGAGMPLGYMKSGALVTVAAESGQTADTVVAENVVKMFARLLPVGLARASWRINSEVIPQLALLKIGNDPIWTPPNAGFAGAPGGYLMGRPIKITEHSDAIGDVGDIQLIDPKGYYGLRKEGGIKFASSIHLFFDYGVQAFRWTVRFGGQPHLTAPVSPAKGSATKSHFVTLAAR